MLTVDRPGMDVSLHGSRTWISAAAINPAPAWLFYDGIDGRLRMTEQVHYGLKNKISILAVAHTYPRRHGE